MKQPCEYLIADEKDIEELPTVAEGNGKHTTSITQPGIFRLTSKNSVLMAVLINNNRGQFDIYDGTHRLLFRQPSSFTGSFPPQPFCEGGIIVRNTKNSFFAANVTFTWMELG